MKRPRALIWILPLVALVFFWMGRMSSGPPAKETHEIQAPVAAEQSVFSCPMHPQIKLPEMGGCPICGMDLVPLEVGNASESPRQLAMSKQDMRLAEIVTAPIERRFVTKEIRMVGKVDYDETRIRTVAAWIPGQNRLDRLYVDYTGVKVQKGDHLVWLFSPELLSAQEELLEAKKRLATTEGERSAFLAESNRKSYSTARDKLLLWGLTEEQVNEIEARGTAEDHMMITSPVSGVVVHKAVNQGDYVGVGHKIYQIADLSQLWIFLDVYEQDLSWIRYGQEVSVHTEANPGQVFPGWISFIDPILDENTRTVKVRVKVDNPQGMLKPGMFVRALVRSQLALGGKVMEPSLAGKWISPMHPEIVKDEPGSCDVCGMDLVPAEELDFVSPDDVAVKPIVVPASAVLVTGKRAVVYVEVPNQERPAYEGREVVLGHRAGDYYIVLAGLNENERVVVHGAFKIDSALQIQAKPSMMSMEAGVYLGKRTAHFRTLIQPLYEAYLAIQEALAGDDLVAAQVGFKAAAESLDLVLPTDLERGAQDLWNAEKKLMQASLPSVPASRDLEELRTAFREFSSSIIALEHAFGHVGLEARQEVFCPMAFDGEGAAWIQRSDGIRNPYFGASMLACGETRHTIPGQGGVDAKAQSQQSQER